MLWRRASKSIAFVSVVVLKVNGRIGRKNAKFYDVAEHEVSEGRKVRSLLAGRRLLSPMRLEQYTVHLL